MSPLEGPLGLRVQGLVHIFMVLAALGLGAGAYFALAFTPIEALVTALCFGTLSLVLFEREMRRRAEARLEKGIEELSRLLSTDAQAGSVLSQRVNALADIEAGARIEGLEADLSVLGTVVRQVAEAVADIEEDRRRNPGAPAPAAPAPATPPAEPAPAFAPEMLRRALDANRLALYIQPIVLLPSRKPQGYDLVPRLPLEEGGFAEADEFLPRSGHDELVRRLEQVLLEEAVIIARRARTAGQPTMLHLVLSRASFGDPASLERIAAVLDANQAIADALVFDIPFSQWQSLTPARRVPLGALSRKGVGFSLGAATTLRLDYSELAGLGFRMVRVDAARFIEEPRSLSDFEAGDIAAFSRRYGIELCATGVRSEQQLLSLYEDGITLAQGGHIAAPGPVRPDLTVERPARPPVPRRAEA